MLMRPNELKEVLEELNIQVFYNHTTRKDEVNLPFIVFYDSGDTSFYADDITYAYSTPYTVVLHCHERDFELEGRMRELFTQHGIPYSLNSVDWEEDLLMWTTVFNV